MLPHGRAARFLLPFVLPLCLLGVLATETEFGVSDGVVAPARPESGSHAAPDRLPSNRAGAANEIVSRAVARHEAKKRNGVTRPEGRPASAVHALAAPSAVVNQPAPKNRQNAARKIAAEVPSGTGIPSGSGTTTIYAAGRSIELFTYKPENYDGQRFILVFHGMLRNADEYRDHAVAMGNRYQALIVVPRFSSEQFPSECYQQGGLRVGGQLQPKEAWTWQLIPQIVDHVRRIESRPAMPFWMIGHSAGGQFLIRMAGFVQVDAERIVVANPGTYLLPSAGVEYPLGFGGLPQEVAGDEALRRYLAQPITVYLGEADTVRDDDLDTSTEVDAQGLTRWERGQNAFRHAKELALSNGWTFNWKLVTAPSVDHDHKKMFNHMQCDEALSLSAARTTIAARSPRTSYRWGWADAGNLRKKKRLL